jgi:hypothetical protein
MHYHGGKSQTVAVLPVRNVGRENCETCGSWRPAGLLTSIVSTDFEKVSSDLVILAVAYVEQSFNTANLIQQM